MSALVELEHQDLCELRVSAHFVSMLVVGPGCDKPESQ